MRGKSVFKTVLILAIILWALYALYPTYNLLTLNQEERETLEDEGKLVPLVNKSIRMGLDLQGGMYLTLEVDLPTLIEQLANRKDELFETIMEEARGDLNVRTEDFLEILRETCEERSIALNRYWGERGDSDRKVLNNLEKEAKDAMNRSLEILRNRIDQFGVSEPSIQKVGGRRILIQLPGISDPDQAKSLIGKTALLELKLLEESRPYMRLLQRIDRTLAKERGALVIEEDDSEAEEDTTQQESELRESKDKVIGIADLFGEDEVTMIESDNIGEEEAGADTSLLVDEQIFQENPFLALLRTNPQGGHEVSAPVENVKAIQRILDREDIQAIIPPDVDFVWASEAYREADRTYRDLYLLKKETELTGKYLQDAKVTIGSDAQNTGQPVVNFRLDRQGARIISRISSANIGKRLSIVLDNRVISAPSIRSKLGANNQITGIASMDEAKMIGIVLRAGALPAPVRILQERTVGPSLGQDSINSGKFSALVGMCIVILFMILYYKMSGIIADFALILNLTVLMAVLAQFHFVLTLPGVAGIVLTIGMAVDANVLIFERIREELRTGKTVRASIDSGYARSFTTILDANITTFFMALILYQFGSGPVRGFAVTLAIGIMVSMFTALVVSRVIFNHITSRRTLTKLSI